jgi:death on curing protein
LRYLTLIDVLDLHARVIDLAGGAAALRDLGVLQSALAQPRTTFEGSELYPTLEEKTTALMFSLIQNHPFVDGNKRLGYAAADAFLVLNGFHLVASVDVAEPLVVGVASGKVSRETLVAWIRTHMVPHNPEEERAT